MKLLNLQKQRLLILAGDIELNPGPGNQPVGHVRFVNTQSLGHNMVLPVMVVMYGIDHKSCLCMCTQDYKDLERSNVVWKCYKCDSLNCDSFTFRSYELHISNSFQPLTFWDSTIDALNSDCFSSLQTSSPWDHKRSSKSMRSNDTNSSRKPPVGKATNTKSSETSQSDYLPFSDLPNKQNLRLMKINCRSVKENCSEFKAAVSYIKPDIITEVNHG